MPEHNWLDVLTKERAESAERLRIIDEMMLSPLQRIYGRKGRVYAQVPSDAPAPVKGLAETSSINFLRFVEDIFRQVLVVNGFESDVSRDDAVPSPWKLWQNNRMDTRQDAVHQAAIRYGLGYSVVRRTQYGPQVTQHAPTQMTAVWDEFGTREWPRAAMLVGESQVHVWDQSTLYRYGFKNPAAGLQESNLVPLGQEPHGFPVCPVVAFRDEQTVDGVPALGVVEPLVGAQIALEQTNFDLAVVKYFQAFAQWYAIGLDPDKTQDMRAGAGRIWKINLPPDSVKIDALTPGDLGPMLDVRARQLMDLAALGHVPPHALGVGTISNVSGETVAALETGRKRRTAMMQRSLGESHEQVARLCSYAVGDMAGWLNTELECRWDDSQPSSLPQLIDGVAKLIAVGYPAVEAFAMLPFVSGQTLDRLKAAASANRLTALLQKPASADAA